MTYTFKLHQTVRLVRTPSLDKRGSTPTEYEIIRLMPADPNGEVSYRIKSGLTELSVREHEIKA
ncbi:hypothetical protein SLNSH_20920 [Alsobacter soli]|uniref:Uncharacterized protein n=1 Tax=Alsobacter soli TaxID=2109933 RepID=A0A2T1HN78_9HYPH|nr:hypothetical protein [Alsobacter soli]PSC03087.1 hypothetical protein SLNSH_20920 [Alsobacter soli]